MSNASSHPVPAPSATSYAIPGIQPSDPEPAHANPPASHSGNAVSVPAQPRSEHAYYALIDVAKQRHIALMRATADTYYDDDASKGPGTKSTSWPTVLMMEDEEALRRMPQVGARRTLEQAKFLVEAGRMLLPDSGEESDEDGADMEVDNIDNGKDISQPESAMTCELKDPDRHTGVDPELKRPVSARTPQSRIQESTDAKVVGSSNSQTVTLQSQSAHASESASLDADDDVNQRPSSGAASYGGVDPYWHEVVDEGGVILVVVPPVAFTPSTARSCATELKKVYALWNDIPLHSEKFTSGWLDVMYCNIQTTDRAIFESEEEGGGEVTFTLLSSLNQAGMSIELKERDQESSAEVWHDMQ